MEGECGRVGRGEGEGGGVRRRVGWERRGGGVVGLGGEKWVGWEREIGEGKGRDKTEGFFFINIFFFFFF